MKKLCILLTIACITLSNVCLAYTQYPHKEYPREIHAVQLAYSTGDPAKLYRLFYAEQEHVLYIVMHGSKDGRNYNGVMPEEAVQELCLRNIKVLGDKPLDKIVIVCCYPGYHKDTEVEEWLVPVEFISNVTEPIIAASYDDKFMWWPESEYHE